MTNRNDSAFSFSSPYHDEKGLTKFEYFAAIAMTIPRSKEDVEFHIGISKKLNPYNEPHKPPILGIQEVKIKMAVLDAIALIDALNISE